MVIYLITVKQIVTFTRTHTHVQKHTQGHIHPRGQCYTFNMNATAFWCDLKFNFDSIRLVGRTECNEKKKTWTVHVNEFRILLLPRSERFLHESQKVRRANSIDVAWCISLPPPRHFTKSEHKLALCFWRTLPLIRQTTLCNGPGSYQVNWA